MQVDVTIQPLNARDRQHPYLLRNGGKGGSRADKRKESGDLHCFYWGVNNKTCVEANSSFLGFRLSNWASNDDDQHASNDTVMYLLAVLLALGTSASRSATAAYLSYSTMHVWVTSIMTYKV